MRCRVLCEFSHAAAPPAVCPARARWLCPRPPNTAQRNEKKRWPNAAPFVSLRDSWPEYDYPAYAVACVSKSLARGSAASRLPCSCSPAMPATAKYGEQKTAGRTRLHSLASVTAGPGFLPRSALLRLHTPRRRCQPLSFSARSHRLRLRPSNTTRRNEKPLVERGCIRLASPTAGPSTITRHTLLSSLLCLARQQRRQPLSPPVLTGWPQSAFPCDRVGRMDDDRVNHYAGRASGRCPCGYPNSGCACRCGRNPMNESPAGSVKGGGGGEPR